MNRSATWSGLLAVDHLLSMFFGWVCDLIGPNQCEGREVIQHLTQKDALTNYLRRNFRYAFSSGLYFSILQSDVCQTL